MSKHVHLSVGMCQEHKDELALGVGAAVVLGLGLAVDIPEAGVHPQNSYTPM